MLSAKGFRTGVALPILAALFIAGCFVYTFHVGRRMPYSPDDMMNLYRAWSMTPLELLRANLTLAGGERPLGAAFYRAQFALWGFRSQPLHGAVWTLLAFNLGLAWLLFRRLGAEAEAAVWGVSILALHGGLRDLSYNTGTLYDALCFTFYVAALLVYLRARERGVPNWRSLLLFDLLLICALDSKEMAVSLPLVVLLWETVFHPPESWSVRALARKLTGEWRGLLWSIPLVLFFSWMTLSSSSAIHNHPAYTPMVTWHRWLETSGEYLALAFYAGGHAGIATMAVYGAAIAAALIAIAMRLKSIGPFAMLWFPITLLPISFITARNSGYILYIPLLLWALYAGTLLARLRRQIAPSEGLAAAVSQVALAALLAAGFGALNRVGPPDPPSMVVSPVERTVRQFKAQYPRVQGPSRMLFLEDPFTSDNYTLLFILRLLYRNPQLEVHRLSAGDDQHPPLDRLPHYDHIFAYRQGRYIELDHADTNLAIAVRLPLGQSLGEHLTIAKENMDPYVVRSVLDGEGVGRWTGAEPEFRFKLSGTRGRRLVARIYIPPVTLEQNGPKDIFWSVNGRPLARAQYNRSGEQLVSFAVPDAWLSTEGLTTAGMRIANPFIAEDQVRLGVVVTEVGFE